MSPPEAKSTSRRLSAVQPPLKVKAHGERANQGLYRLQGDGEVRVHANRAALAAADRLPFTAVVAQCEQFMAENLNAATAAVFYSIADRHCLQMLKQVVAQYFQNHLPSVVQDESGWPNFKALGRECIMHFLSTGNSEWHKGTHLLGLLDKLSSAGISRETVLDCIYVEECSVQELNEIRAHPSMRTCGKQFLDRIAATTLRHADYLTHNNSTDEFLPIVALHLEAGGGHSKLAVCWHVTNWSGLPRQGQPHWSPEFVIPGKGSWRLMLYPNGYGDATGSHVSVFLERGGSSSAPMTLTFTFCLLSPKPRMADGISLPLANASFAAPGIRGSALGCSKFMPIDTVEQQRDIWIQDDTMVLAVLYKP